MPDCYTDLAILTAQDRLISHDALSCVLLQSFMLPCSYMLAELSHALQAGVTKGAGQIEQAHNPLCATC